MPELRFPGFEGTWEAKFIKNVLQIGSGKDYKHLDEGNIPVYGTGGLMNHVNDFLYDGESVCIGRKGTIDKPNFIVGKFWTVDTLFYTHSFNNVIPFFMFLIAQKINWKKYNEASGVPSLSKSTIEKIAIVIPTLPEQQKIASFFTTIDKKIELLKKKHSLLEQYKKGVMQKIFAQEIRFKDENGKKYPDWEEKKLGEVSLKKSSNISANTITDNNGDYLIYGAAGVLKSVDFYNEEDRYISIVKDGAGVGRVLRCESKTSVLGTLDIIKNKKSNLDFLFYLLLQVRFYKYITGSTIPHIYYKDYSKEKVTIPCIQEQTKIANFLSAIDKKIEKVQLQIDKAEEWKKGLLGRMFC